MLLAFIAWLTWLILGAVAGWIASRVRRRPHALMTNVYVGVLGAALGGFLFSLIGIPTITDFNPASILGALIGTIVLLVLLHALSPRRVVIISPTGQVVPEATIEPVNRRDEIYESTIKLHRAQIHIAIPIALIIILPLLDTLLLRLKIPDISSMPPRFGTVATYESGQGRLDYLVYTPASYQQGSALPLLLFLHGCTQDPYQLETASGMRAVADANNFIVVYPQQNSSSSPHRCWNWYDEHNQQRDTGEPSLLVGIVNQVEQQYSVDTQRVYVAGISSGGAMTSILASCYPDVFAAAAVHSGMSYDSSNSVIQAIIAPLRGSQVEPETAGYNGYQCAGTASRPIPTIVLHGSIDTIVFPINALHTIEQLAQEDDYADDGTDNDSVRAEPTSTEVQQVEGGHSYVVENYEYNGELLLQRYVVEGLWHMWSGGTGTLPLSDPKAPNASQIFWDFMSVYTLPSA